ncbi:MAG: hypothetical protein KJ955_01625 [Nanoarchaeota archaeon]|nr:hypothetical protein [Nanoarchaeota archaeon]
MQPKTKLIKAAIKLIKKSKKALKETSMQDLVEASAGYKVIPFNKIKHKKILLEIIALGRILVSSFRNKVITRKKYNRDLNKKTKAFRNNEIGGYCEFKIREEFYKNKSRFKVITYV